MHTIKISGDIKTTISGQRFLISTFNELLNEHDSEIFLDFSNLIWLDANLSALVNAMIFKLNQTNNLVFTTDFSYLKREFNVLFRNGFIREKGKTIIDDRNSVVKLEVFDITESDKFTTYIEQNLFNSRGMRKVNPEQQERMIYDFIELYSNIKLHSKTEHPFFACGQLFPVKKYLNFSIVDLGIGFLPTISKMIPEIDTHKKAIEWAIQEGNTTRTYCPEKTAAVGGLGLSGILDYCKNNEGRVQIMTGDVFFEMNSMESNLFSGKYCFDNTVTHQLFGTVVNLSFKY